MTREEIIKRHNQNVKKAFAAAQQGEVINLSALMGGRQTLMTDTTQEGEGIYSDNWAIKKEGGK